MTHTHTPADWAAAGSLGISAAALIPLVLAFADADPADLDPRPAVRRAVTAGHQTAVHAGHDLNCALATSQRTCREAWAQAWLTLAALLILTIPTGDNS